MSEQLKPTHEQHGEKLPSHEQLEHYHNRHERELTKAEKEHGTEKNVEQLSKHVEQHAVSGKERAVGETESTHNNHPVIVNAQLKDMAFSRAMTRTRKQLSPFSRTFSKVIHNKTVDRASEAIGKTVARPMSVLWGAIFAFVGSSALLWITRHYGYEYNYLAAILLFIGGAILGITIESVRYVRKNTTSD